MSETRGERRTEPHCCVVGFDGVALDFSRLTNRGTSGIDPRSPSDRRRLFRREHWGPDAQSITYRHRAQRRHRTVGSTERLAARGRARL